jgi:hypothetical protein
LQEDIASMKANSIITGIETDFFIGSVFKIFGKVHIFMQF